MSETRRDSYCGLYCGACSALRATEEGRHRELARDEGLDPEDLRCRGCKSQLHSIWCTECPIRECAAAREVEYCWQCQQYPCGPLSDFEVDEQPHHRVFRSQEILRSRGPKIWLQYQRRRWSCPHCGSPICWYDEVCGECSQPVKSCTDGVDRRCSVLLTDEPFG